MTFSPRTIASSKLQQFTLPGVDSTFAFYKPIPPLAEFVETIWAARGGDSDYRPERILPTGTFELAINLRRDKLSFYDVDRPETLTEYSGSVVSGAHSRCFAPADEDEVSVIGVHFKPGGAFPFLGMPAGDLADSHVDLDSLWGLSAAVLRDRLCEAGTVERRFELLEMELIKRLREGVERHYAVSAALEMFRTDELGSSVGEAAKSIGLSQRRFIQVFKAEVGLTPKLFSRIRRFQHARSLVHLRPSPDWTDLALECGYYDQSHFIREFAEFSGLSPTDYLDRQRLSV